MSAWQEWLEAVAPLERRLAHPAATSAIAIVAIFVLLAAGLPFGLWYGLGPERFEPLTLGQAPTEIPVIDPGQPNAVSGQSTGTDRLAPDIPLDLGPDVRVTLLFSVGSQGLTSQDASELRVADADARGEDGLTDVLMLVIADPDSGQVALLSLPRDLWLPSRQARINATWSREGTQALVDNISDVTGLPIHHLAQVNFTAFGELVDRLGGVAVATDRALADVAARLYVPEAGCWRLTGADALAFVRSRKTLTMRDGRWVSDASASDFGRIARQQQLLAAAFDQIRGPQLVRRIPDLLQVARGGLVVDDGLGLVELRFLAEAFQDVSAGSFEGFTVPARNERIGGAAVLIPTEEVRPIMQRLRSWPPGDPVPQGSVPLGAAIPGQPLASPIAATPPAPPAAGCSLADASDLPDPNAPLADIARGPGGGDPAPSPGGARADTDGTTTNDEPSDTQREPSAPTSEPPPEPDADEPSAPPSDDAPNEEPTSEPSPSPAPSDEPSDDDDGGGILPLP